MPRLASPDRMAGPDPAAGWPKRTSPPTPAAANGVEAPRSENSPLTMSSCSTRCGTDQLLTGAVHVECGGCDRDRVRPWPGTRPATPRPQGTAPAFPNPTCIAAARLSPRLCRDTGGPGRQAAERPRGGDRPPALSSSAGLVQRHIEQPPQVPGRAGRRCRYGCRTNPCAPLPHFHALDDASVAVPSAILPHAGRRGEDAPRRCVDHATLRARATLPAWTERRDAPGGARHSDQGRQAVNVRCEELLHLRDAPVRTLGDLGSRHTRKSRLDASPHVVE